MYLKKIPYVVVHANTTIDPESKQFALSIMNIVQQDISIQSVKYTIRVQNTLLIALFPSKIRVSDLSF